MSAQDYNLVTFTPVEAGEASGVNPNTQRQWRNRGYLPRYDARSTTRFNAVEVAAMIVRRALNEASSKLNADEPFIALAAMHVLEFAIKTRPDLIPWERTEAVFTEPGKPLYSYLVARNPPVRDALAPLASPHMLEPLSELGRLWMCKSLDHVDHIMQLGEPAESVVLIDLQTLGEKLARGFPGPIATLAASEAA